MYRVRQRRVTHWGFVVVFFSETRCSFSVNFKRLFNAVPKTSPTLGWYKNVKFFHTPYRPLGPGLIPVYRQSACRWRFKSPSAVGCHYFPPSPGSTNEELLSTSTKLYCLVTEAHRCGQLIQDCYTALSRWELNLQPTDPKSNALLLRHCIYIS